MTTSATPSPCGTSIAADLADEFQRMHEFEIKSTTTPRGEVALFAVVPNGKQLVSVRQYAEEYLKKPLRRIGTSTHQTIGSFIDHVLRFANDDTAVFADPKPLAPSLTAVLDYHPEGGNVEEAAFGKHRSVYAAPLSAEWKAWVAKNGAVFSQAEFAGFLEERLLDVVVVTGETADEGLRQLAAEIQGAYASPSQLMKLSRGLEVNVDSVVKEVLTLDTGEIDIKYTEQHKDGAGAPMKVPNLFAIQIPVFYAGHVYRIPVRLRYRVSGGRVTWSYQLVRIDRVFDDAFGEVIEQVRTNTTAQVFVGSPEA